MSSLLPDTHEIAKPVSLWRNRDYMILWSGQTISSLGTGVSGLAFPLLVLALTHSPAQAGFVAAVFGLPYLIFSLPAGALIDRWNRKRVMILCDTVRLLNMATIPVAAAFGVLTIPQIYVNSLVEGTAFVFFNVAEVAALPRVVAKSQLPEASAQNQGAMFASTLVSPPLGGILFQLARSLPFLVDAVSYIVSVVSLMFIKTEFQLERVAERRKLLVEIKEGVAWLWSQPLIRFMTFLTAGLNFYGNATYLVLIILAKRQHASPSVIGVMFAIASVGGLLGSFVAPRIQRRFGYSQVVITSVWVGAIATVLLAVAPNPLVLGAVAAVTFLSGPIYNAVQFSYRVSLIPDELQGRVNSTVRMFAFGAIPLGSALAGVLLQTIGPVSAVLLFAGVAFLLALLTSANSHVRSAPRVPETLPA